MDFPHTPAPADSSASAESLATSRFDHAAALLRSASSTVVPTVGATFAGRSRDGGVINDGGESNSLLFWSFGGYVNVGPGGFGGGKIFPHGGGDSFGKGMNAAPGTGEVSAAQEEPPSVALRWTPRGVVTQFRVRPRYKLQGGGGYWFQP